MKFVVVHIWPNDTGTTIMADLFKTFEEARIAATLCERQKAGGHRYDATALPITVEEMQA